MRAKCKDCEQIIEEWGSRKDHLCKQCYIRKVNCKNRGIEYIPVKDLDEKERMKVFKRRGIVPKDDKVTVKKIKAKVVKDENTILDEEAKRILKNKELVLEDIEKTLKSNNIDFKADDYDIYPLMTSLKSFLETYIENKDKLSAVKTIYNNMSTDYCHSKEYWSTEYFMNFMDYSPEERAEVRSKKENWDNMHSVLLGYRRIAMYVINQFELVAGFFDTIINNKEQLDMFFDVCDKLDKFKEAYENKKYIAESSSLVASEDFSLGIKEDNGTEFIFKIELRTYGYNPQTGKRTVGVFSRTFEATSKKEALKKLAEFHKAKGFTWSYAEAEAIVTNLGPVLQTKVNPQQ